MNTKTYSTSFLPPLQHALFQAAKVGHIKLIQELIQAGADPLWHRWKWLRYSILFGISLSR